MVVPSGAEEVCQEISVGRKRRLRNSFFRYANLLTAFGRSSPERLMKARLEINPFPVRRHKSRIASFCSGKLNLIASVGIHSPDLIRRTGNGFITSRAFIK